MKKIIFSIYHFLLALLGAIIYGFPSKKIKVIGITGTKGKTTTTEMVKAIFEKAGIKTASISSIRFTLGKKEWENKLKMTMPGRFKLQKFLRQAVNEKCQYAVFEATSEGIIQHRHRFIEFEAVVFTNLSPEHIERHGSFEKYREAKLKLFKHARGKTFIINIDDNNAKYFLQIKAKEKWSYGVKRPASLVAKNCQQKDNGISFTVNGVKFELPLVGKFNIYNALAAICISLSQGLTLKDCLNGLKGIKAVPGRMEIVVEDPFKVVVDYAHTPDSLEKVYKALKKDRRMICVLGSAGGGRDKWKRPKMGEKAAQYCDKIIITNEDPYDEDPKKIIEQVAKGAKGKALIVLDREEAIKKAINMAKRGDVVIITGKGSECWMCLSKGKKIPWSDKQVVLKNLRF